MFSCAKFCDFVSLQDKSRLTTSKLSWKLSKIHQNYLFVLGSLAEVECTFFALSTQFTLPYAFPYFNKSKSILECQEPKPTILLSSYQQKFQSQHNRIEFQLYLAGTQKFDLFCSSENPALLRRFETKRIGFVELNLNGIHSPTWQQRSFESF